MKPLSPKAVSHYCEGKDVCAHSAVFNEETRHFARFCTNTFKHPFVEGKMMIHLKPITHKVIAAISTFAISASALMLGAGSAQAADGQVTVDYTSTTRADYSYLSGSANIGEWTPWGGAEAGLNAADVDWAGDPDWTKNFKVADGVLKVQKPQAAPAYAGALVAVLDANQTVVSSGHTTVTVDVSAADSGVKYTAYATDALDANGVAADAVASGKSGSLTFTFTPVDGIYYSKLWLQPDSNLAVAGATNGDWGFGGSSAGVSKLYTFDNLSYYLTTASAPLPRTATRTKLTFETGDATGALAVSNGFEGATAAIADAPAGGLGTKALSIVKTDKAWGGVNVLQSPNITDKYTDATHKVASLNFYSPIDADVPVVLELSPGAVQVTAIAHKGWQKLTFDFGTAGSWSDAVEYTTVALFPNYQVAAVLEDTYFVDNISFNGVTAPSILGEQQDGAVTLDYTSNAREDYGYLVGSSTVEWSPWGDVKDATGVDWKGDTEWTHNYKVTDGVLKVHKAQAGTASAGILVALLANDKSVVSTTNNTITVDATAADAGVKYTAYATDSNDGSGITAVATVVGTSGTLTFTFSPAVGVAYSKLWLQPDSDLAAAGNGHEDWGFGTDSATNSKLYTFDNLSYVQSAASAPAPRVAASTQITFEAGDALGAAAQTQYFEGAITAIVDAPVGGAGTKAMSITKSTKSYGGVNILLHPTSTDKYTDATHKTVSLNFYSPIDAAVPVVLELNPGAVQATATAHRGWQTLTFDFGAPSAGTWSDAVDYTTVALFPNFLVDAVPTDIYYVDNISFNGATAPAIALKPTVTAAAATAASAISATKTLAFTVKTFAGAVVPGATVTFATNAKGKVSKTTATADANGVARVVVSASGAGSQVVVATYVDGDGNSGNASTTVTWSVPRKSVAVSISKRTVTIAVTNGKGTRVTVTATGGYKLVFTPTQWAKTSKTLKLKKAGTFTVKVTTSGVSTVSKKYKVK